MCTEVAVYVAVVVAVARRAAFASQEVLQPSYIEASHALGEIPSTRERVNPERIVGFWTDTAVDWYAGVTVRVGILLEGFYSFFCAFAKDAIAGFTDPLGVAETVEAVFQDLYVAAPCCFRQTPRTEGRTTVGRIGTCLPEGQAGLQPGYPVDGEAEVALEIGAKTTYVRQPRSACDNAPKRIP